MVLGELHVPLDHSLPRCRSEPLPERMTPRPPPRYPRAPPPLLPPMVAVSFWASWKNPLRQVYEYTVSHPVSLPTSPESTSTSFTTEPGRQVPLRTCTTTPGDATSPDNVYIYSVKTGPTSTPTSCVQRPSPKTRVAKRQVPMTEERHVPLRKTNMYHYVWRHRIRQAQ